MIRQEPSQLPPGTRDLRRFGMIAGGVFLLLGAGCLLRHRPAGSYLTAIGALLFVLGLALPRTLRRVYVAWSLLALLLGLLMSGGLLTLLYLLVITPVSLVARLMGAGFLSLRRDPLEPIRAPSHRPEGDPSAASKPEDHEQHGF